MKDPKRYTLVQINDEHWMHENKNRMNAAPAGEYVLFDDYARLKAEYERLRASSFVTAVPVEEYEKLKAEVENSSRINRELLVLCNQQASRVRNLIEAGDEMALGIEGDYNYPMPCVQAWNAAKHGKPSA